MSRRLSLALVSSALLVGCTINAPNATLSNQAPITATANTTVTAEVNGVAASPMPTSLPSELPPIAVSLAPLVPSPTPTAMPTASPSPSPTPKVYSPDLYWRYSTAKFEFIYPKAWDNLENSARTTAGATCLANIARRSPTGYSDFGVFENKTFVPLVDLVAYIRAIPDAKITSEEDFSVNGVTGKTVYFSTFKNGVETTHISTLCIKDGVSFELFFSSTESKDRLAVVIEEVNITLNTWVWK